MNLGLSSLLLAASHFRIVTASAFYVAIDGVEVAACFIALCQNTAVACSGRIDKNEIGESSQVSALSIVTGGADGEGDVSSRGNREGPWRRDRAEAEAAPGPPLIANVTGRLAEWRPRTEGRGGDIGLWGEALGVAQADRPGNRLEAQGRRPGSSIHGRSSRRRQGLGAIAVGVCACPGRHFVARPLPFPPPAVLARQRGNWRQSQERPVASNDFKMLGIDFIERVLYYPLMTG